MCYFPMSLVANIKYIIEYSIVPLRSFKKNQFVEINLIIQKLALTFFEVYIEKCQGSTPN